MDRGSDGLDESAQIQADEISVNPPNPVVHELSFRSRRGRLRHDRREEESQVRTVEIPRRFALSE